MSRLTPKRDAELVADGLHAIAEAIRGLTDAIDRAYGEGEPEEEPQTTYLDGSPIRGG